MELPLPEDASRDLALIIGENAVSEVIDLERAFADPSLTLSPGRHSTSLRQKTSGQSRKLT